MIEIPKEVSALKNDDADALKKIYLEHKTTFMRYAQRFDIQYDVVLDIYQDSIIALVENAKKGNIDQLQSSIGTYLIGIGKYMVYEHFRRIKKHKDLGFDKAIAEQLQDFEINEDTLSNKEKALKKAFENLGSQCKKILTLFYYEEKKLDEIQVILNYESKDVLKSQKHRCLSHLKKMLRGT